MTPGLSLWLDVLRAAAALTVMFGHLAHVRFTRGDYVFLRELNVAADAVVVFFVISGCVIAFAATRDGNPKRFAFNRVTRLVSVVLPALLLTALFDAMGTRINPDAYPDPYYIHVPFAELMLRGATFSNEWSGLLDRVRLGSNGPLWSLSYEAAYYALFGIAVFSRGPVRIALLVAAGSVFGLPILALMPAWLAGVVVWKAISQTEAVRFSPSLGLSLAIGAPACAVVMKAMGLDVELSGLTADLFHPVSHHAILLYADEALWSMVLGAAIGLHLLGVAALTRRGSRADRAPGLAKAVRWCAGASFSLYVTHYPSLHLFDALLPEQLIFRDLLLAAAVLCVALLFAELFERRLSGFRAGLKSLAGGTRSRVAGES